MTKVWHSFIDGWRNSARLWPVVLLLYAVDAAFAVALTVAPASQLAAAFGYSAMAPKLVEVPSLDMLLELLTNTDLTGFPWLLYLLVPLASVIVTTFLRGGVLEALARRERGPSAAEFFAACARFFPRLLAILVLVSVGLAAVAVMASILGLILGTGLFSGFLALSVGLVIQPLGIALVLAMADYARVSLVLEPARPILSHVGWGIRFAIARAPQAALLALLFWVVATVLAGLYPLLLGPWPVLSSFTATLGVQQILSLLASWHRTAMLGAEMALYQTVTGLPNTMARIAKDSQDRSI